MRWEGAAGSDISPKECEALECILSLRSSHPSHRVTGIALRLLSHEPLPCPARHGTGRAVTSSNHVVSHTSVRHQALDGSL